MSVYLIRALDKDKVPSGALLDLVMIFPQNAASLKEYLKKNNLLDPDQYKIIDLSKIDPSKPAIVCKVEQRIVEAPAALSKSDEVPVENESSEISGDDVSVDYDG